MSNDLDQTIRLHWHRNLPWAPQELEDDSFRIATRPKYLIVIPDGPLEKEDFEKLANEVDPFLESKGKLAGLMICAKSFPGWESFGAIVSHLKFVADHHRRIERRAAVTDSGFLKDRAAYRQSLRAGQD